MNEPEIITTTITHKCGHVVTYSFPGPRRIFHRSDVHLTGMLCEACRREPPTPKATISLIGDRAEIAIVRGSYENRDAIKARGYTYFKEYTNDHPKAWVLKCSQGEAEIEVTWMKEQGWNVEFCHAEPSA